MSPGVVGVDKPWPKTIPFSLGVVAEGRLPFTAGITARDPNGALVGAGEIRKQMEQCFANLGDVLKAAGAGWGDVVKWTMYTSDIDAFSKHAEIYRRHFIDRPASTLVRRLGHRPLAGAEGLRSGPRPWRGPPRLTSTRW